MQSTNWRDMLGKIKKCYEELSGASKCVIVLMVLLIMSNITINIWSSRTYRDVEQAIDNVINDNTYNLLQCFGFAEIFDKAFELIKFSFFVVISAFAYYISLCVGKVLGLVKSITEFLSDIKEDSYLLVMFGVYDIIGLAFDLYTFFSIITA